MDKAQIKFACAFNGTENDTIEWEEFFCFTLLRLGVCDMDMFDSIKEHFYALDLDASGELEKNELLAAMHFGRFDNGQTGKVNQVDFYLLFTDFFNEATSKGKLGNSTQEYLGQRSSAERVWQDLLLLDPKNVEILAAEEANHTAPEEQASLEVGRRQFMIFWIWMQDETAVDEWFATHGSEWLDQDSVVHLPLVDPNPDRKKVIKRTVDIFVDGESKNAGLQKNYSSKKLDLEHFFEYSQTKEGAAWLKENEGAWKKDPTILPAEFIRTKTRKGAEKVLEKEPEKHQDISV